MFILQIKIKTFYLNFIIIYIKKIYIQKKFQFFFNINKIATKSLAFKTIMKIY